jgi:hypothetical protein
MIIDSTNLAGEYVLVNSCTLDFTKARTALLWHHFPDGASANHSFPDGGFVPAYSFSGTTPGISGINYDVSLNSCYDVMWGMMPEGNTDITINDSEIRAIGLWFTGHDSVNLSGITGNAYYNSYPAPLTDRNLQLNNTSVQTWSVYTFDSVYVNITGCITGEVGAMGHSQILATGIMVDGSGGYYWSSDNSIVFTSSASVFTNSRSERNSFLIYGYSSVVAGNASATGNSVFIAVQSIFPFDPVPYDYTVVWNAFLSVQPSAYLGDLISISGSAWIDKASEAGLMDFGYYSVAVKQISDTSWIVLDDSVTSEVRSDVLAEWNTAGFCRVYMM